MKELVPQLETCKKLDELGLFQESKGIYVFNVMDSGVWQLMSRDASDILVEKYHPTPIAEEVLKELPKKLVIEDSEDYDDIGTWYLGVFPLNDGWMVQYSSEYADELLYDTNNKSLSEAAAQMMIWLHENGYLTKTEQCFCQSYCDDDGIVRGCICGKCKER